MVLKDYREDFRVGNKTVPSLIAVFFKKQRIDFNNFTSNIKGTIYLNFRRDFNYIEGY